MWRRVEERENFKCLLHKMPLIFEYPYQALFKTKCVWGGKYSKTMKVVLWRAAWMPCNSTYLQSWSTCPAFHHPFWERNPRHDAARAPLFAVSDWMISVSTNLFFFPLVPSKRWKERVFQAHSFEMWGNTNKVVSNKKKKVRAYCAN